MQPHGGSSGIGFPSAFRTDTSQTAGRPRECCGSHTSESQGRNNTSSTSTTSSRSNSDNSGSPTTPSTSILAAIASAARRAHDCSGHSHGAHEHGGHNKGEGSIKIPEPETTTTQACCAHGDIDPATRTHPSPVSSDGEVGGGSGAAHMAPRYRPAAEEHDLERGPPLPDDKEHVVVAIQGMDCATCETKIMRSMTAAPGVSGVRASTALDRVEFDVDRNVASAEEAIAYLERKSGFECTRIFGGGVAGNQRHHDITVLAHGLEGTPYGLCRRQKRTDEPLPRGVVEIIQVGETYVGSRITAGCRCCSRWARKREMTNASLCRIVYDTEATGARDIVERAFGKPLRLATVPPDPTLALGRKHVRHAGLRTLLSALLTIPVLVLAWAPLRHKHTRRMEILYGAVSLALATTVQILVAGPFYPAALRSLVFSRVVEMDLLVVLSTSTAYVFSVVAFALMVARRPLSTGELFETSTLLVTLIVLGRWVAALAKQRALESVSVRATTHPTAMLIEAVSERPSGGGAATRLAREIDARLLQHGDIFRVAPDASVVTDGVVVAGSSEVDESILTGESRAVPKEIGSSVVAGSLNVGGGALEVRLTRLPGDDTISTISKMVDQARLTKPHAQDVADRVAGYLVPVVCVLALATFAGWAARGILHEGKPASNAVAQAITYAIAVLIVSCPCAIGLAVPMVVVVAGGVGAERGVVFKTTRAIEVARRVTHVVFDKTGTLTWGRPEVEREAYLGPEVDPRTNRDPWLAAVILALVQGNNHPVSVAVAAHLQSRNVGPLPSVHGVKTIPGKGVEGTCGGQQVRAGNAQWLGLLGHPEVESLLAARLTVLCVEVDGELAAVYGLRDTLRSEAREVVDALRAGGIAVSIVSGDAEGAVADVAAKLGIDKASATFGASPTDKQRIVQSLVQDPSKQQGKREQERKLWPPSLQRCWRTKHSSSSSHTQPVVVFVGDGTNDAAALAAASVGVHMSPSASTLSSSSSVSELSRSAADVVLTRSDLRGLLVLTALSRAVMRRVVFNFAWSFAYNVMAVLLAAGAFATSHPAVRIPPAYAGLGEIVSVVPVIGAAVALRWARLGEASAKG